MRKVVNTAGDRRASVGQGASPCVRRSAAEAWSLDRRGACMSNTILLPFRLDPLTPGPAGGRLAMHGVQGFFRFPVSTG
jgi:hypothetical protein